MCVVARAIELVEAPTDEGHAHALARAAIDAYLPLDDAYFRGRDSGRKHQLAKDERAIEGNIERADTWKARAKATAGQVATLDAEITRLRAIVDSPDPFGFWEASVAEAQFQRMKWEHDGDEGKAEADWFWFIGYLAGKALHNPDGDLVKKLHRITTIAVAAANWHAAISGDQGMRPGIAEPPPMAWPCGHKERMQCTSACAPQ